MKIEEVREGREWVVSLASGPVKVVLDRRLKPRTYKNKLVGEILDPGIHSYPEEREIRAPTIELLRGALGHELGHIDLGHEGLLGEKEEFTPQWIREEVEAEEWSYAQGFPYRKGKIEDLRMGALAIGMTGKQFDKMHREVKRRLKER